MVEKTMEKTAIKCGQCKKELTGNVHCQFCGKLICDECPIPQGNLNVVHLVACENHTLKVIIPREYKERIVKKLLGKVATCEAFDDVQRTAFATFLKGEVVKIKEGGW